MTGVTLAVVSGTAGQFPSNTISVSTYYGAAGEKKPLLAEAQLKQVAQLILSRE